MLKNIFTRWVFQQLPFLVLFSREIVRQRRWRCLATGHAGVDKLADYLWNDKKDVNQAKKQISLTAVNFVCIKVRTDQLRTTAAADAISLS